jgi:hypothetical protein
MASAVRIAPPLISLNARSLRRVPPLPFARLVAALALLGNAFVSPGLAQTCPTNVPHVQGTWRTLPYLMPINPISATLLNTGQVLIVSGSENDAYNNSPGAESYRNAVWDPTGTTQSSITVQQINYDVFCSQTAQLPDGRGLIVGGSSSYGFTGDSRASIFDPVTKHVLQSQSMVDGRWYATATTLGDGRVMAFSGLSNNGGTNNTVEIYDLKNAGAGWTSPATAPFVPPLYPRMFLLPNGNVFYTGQGSTQITPNSWIFSPGSGTWAQSVATTIDRTYGSAVLLPLLPPSYKPKVMNFGGGAPSTATTEIIDLSAASPTWALGPNMSTGRIQMNAVILPNGKVLAEGGSVNNEVPDAQGRSADLYDPVVNTFSSGGTASYSRLYHSTALLLPDATVASFGSNPGSRGNYDPTIEIYTPPYLFDSSDRLITTNRPSITAVSATVIGYNSPFSASFTSTSAISSAVLIRLGSDTHAFDSDQRLIGLCGPSPQPSCSGSGTLTLTTPPNSNIAPPGYYMLFLLDSAGVPSVAKFIRLSQYTTTPPRGTITSPSSDTTITAGGSVSFGTTSTAAKYSWVFPSGSPATSTLQNPGNVRFSTPGIYVVSLTVIDSSGNSDPSPPTRTITVSPTNPDFAIAVSPSSSAVIPGQSATYTVTVTPLSGFNGTVSLSVGSESGFPIGITSGGFNPPSIVGTGGSSTLTMNTNTSATPYALSLTITGTSGTITHTGSTTLLVALAAPANLTALPGPGQVSLSWAASVAATSYHLKRALVSGGPYQGIACTTIRSYTDTGLTSGTTYDYVVSAAYQGGPNAGGESADSIQASATPQSSIFTPIRVNAGGGAFTDTATGNVWSADTGFTGGATSATPATITDTANPSQAQLYQTVRYGNFTYQFSVPSGTYTVNLKFAEVYWTSTGQRVFDVLINGQTVLSRFDIVAAAGAGLTAVDKSFTVGPVTQITIQFVTDVDNAAVNAIEILSGSGSGPVGVSVAPSTVTLTASQTQPFTATVTNTTNTAVTWALSPATGAGTLAISGNTATYTAPSSITATQTVTVKATSVADTTKSASATITLTPTGGFTPIRVDAGGGAFTDPATGNVWSADTGFTGGATYTTAATITDTANPSQAPLYKSVRYGNFTYQFTVPNGTYTVNLKFAEVFWTNAGQRVFDVLLNGQTVLSRFDIVAAAGAGFTAVDKSFTVGPVTQITIQFVTNVDNAAVNAIEILSGSAPVGVSVAPSTVTLTASQTQPFTATVTNSANTAVTWALSPATGAGTLSINGNTATYTAPSTITATQTVTVKATSVADPTKSASASITLSPTGFTPIRVNVGDGAFTDTATGNVWSADTGFTGGAQYATTATITDAANPSQAPLYQTARYGNFTYQFTVPTGSYTVILKFAETYWSSAGSRKFNVAINGTTVLTSFDIVAAAGGPLIAIDKSFTVGPTSTITIQFTTVVDNALVNAIQIQ